MAAPHKDRLLVVIPAHNEEASLPEVLAPLLERGYQVVVVDDASVDSTALVAKKAGAIVLRLPVRLGAWCATQTGLRFGLERDVTTFVCMDGDAQHPARHIPQLLEEQERQQADIVIASDPERGGMLKQYTRRIFGIVSRTAVCDSTSGFRVMNRKVATLFAEEKISLFDYQDIGPLCLVREAGMVVSEYSVAFEQRKHGSSRVFDCFLSLVDYMLQSFVLVVGDVTLSSKNKTER